MCQEAIEALLVFEKLKAQSHLSRPSDSNLPT
jgi:hypothetical protein